MGEKFYRNSSVTGKNYDVLSCVKILNLTQAMAYMEHDVFPVDIKIGRDKDNNRRCLIFYFNREESKEVYDKWCKYELGN